MGYITITNFYNLLIRVAFFSNLEELNHFLNTLSDQASDQAKTNNRKALEVFNRWNGQANDQASDQASDQAVKIIESNLNDKVPAILNNLDEPKKRAEILENLGLTNHSRNRERYLDPLVSLGWIEMTIPEKPTHQDQKYKRTLQGEILYNLISGKK